MHIFVQGLSLPPSILTRFVLSNVTFAVAPSPLLRLLGKNVHDSPLFDFSRTGADFSQK